MRQCVKTNSYMGMASTLNQLREMLEDQFYMEETPIEVQYVMEAAAAAIEEALGASQTIAQQPPAASHPAADLPTPKQGQFLAYIQEYMLRNYAGAAPTHAALQRIFNLPAPSVNSMLKRLEARGFIRRTPGQTRAITLTINPEFIPELEHPFKI